MLRTSEATSQQNCPDYCDLSIISDIRKAIFLITGRISLRILGVCYSGCSVKIFYTSNPNYSSLSQKLETFMWTLSCFTLSPCLPTPTPPPPPCACMPAQRLQGRTSEDNFQELVLSLHCVGSGITFRSSGLAGALPTKPSHLTFLAFCIFLCPNSYSRKTVRGERISCRKSQSVSVHSSASFIFHTDYLYQCFKI